MGKEDNTENLLQKEKITGLIAQFKKRTDYTVEDIRKSWALPEESISLLPRKISSVLPMYTVEGLVPEHERIGLGTRSI